MISLRLPWAVRDSYNGKRRIFPFGGMSVSPPVVVVSDQHGTSGVSKERGSYRLLDNPWWLGLGSWKRYLEDVRGGSPVVMTVSSSGCRGL